MPLTVVLQEPRRLVVEGMAELLAVQPDTEVVLAVTDPMRLAASDAPRVTAAVLSIETDERVLARVIRDVRRRHGGIRLVGTYCRAEWRPTGSAATRSLAGVIAHEDGIGALLAALRGQRTTSTGRHLEQPGRQRRASLTPRERDVLVLLAGGCSAQEASDRLRISRKTVENHKQRLFSKLGVQSQAHAVATAMRSGALSPVALDGLSA